MFAKTSARDMYTYQWNHQVVCVTFVVGYAHSPPSYRGMRLSAIVERPSWYDRILDIPWLEHTFVVGGGVMIWC